jgi:hypothetical protein
MYCALARWQEAFVVVANNMSVTTCSLKASCVAEAIADNRRQKMAGNTRQGTAIEPRPYGRRKLARKSEPRLQISLAKDIKTSRVRAKWVRELARTRWSVT